MTARGLALLATFAVTGCRVTSAFSCTQDQECRQGGAVGTCSAPGYCAFPDPACANGLRYDSTAGSGLGGDCVECITYYDDVDGDGHGDPATGSIECAPQAGRVTIADDCDDSSAFAYTNAAEVCDGIDNDCDPTTLESCPTGCTPMKRPPPDEAHTYLFCSSASDWTSAKDTCDLAGFTLVRIDDAAEDTWLTTIIADTSLGHPWSGASDAVTEGVWVWEDGTQFWQGDVAGAPVAGLYSHWRGSQPDDYQHGEDCASIESVDGWNDRACKALASFICEQ